MIRISRYDMWLCECVLSIAAFENFNASNVEASSRQFDCSERWDIHGRYFYCNRRMLKDFQQICGHVLDYDFSIASQLPNM